MSGGSGGARAKGKVDLAAKEQQEIDYWRDMPDEAPGSDTVGNLINKITDAPNLLECLRGHEDLFASARTVLELGAGQGWASCLLKKLHPQAEFIVTDISEYALASLPKWERVFQVSPGRALPCRSYAIPVPDGSVDVIFAYAAAHHFQAHRRTFAEVERVLRPGGACLYLHEPCCRRWIYRLAHWRVNRTRPTVPEDVLVYPKVLRMAREAGLEAGFRFMPTLNKRLPFEFLYYFALRKLPFLQHVLPCTGTFVFIRPRTS